METLCGANDKEFPLVSQSASSAEVESNLQVA